MTGTVTETVIGTATGTVIEIEIGIGTETVIEIIIETEVETEADAEVMTMMTPIAENLLVHGFQEGRQSHPLPLLCRLTIKVCKPVQHVFDVLQVS